MKIFFYTAVVGLILGFMVHLSALLGVDPSEKFPFVWLLHVGVFVVWIPAIVKMNKNEEYKLLHKSRNQNPFKLYALVFRIMPKSIAVLSLFFFVYALFNFLIFMAISEGGGPEIAEGKYVLQSHGTIIRELTESEFVKMKANVVRGFSGHWMAFYSFAMGFLWPDKKKKTDSIQS